MNLNSESEIKGTILLVDDIPENLQLLGNILLEYNYVVRAVTSGKMALKTIKVKPPDLILLDIKMPEMDGYEVCKAIKADENFCDIPVIFISALDEIFDKVKAFKLGGVDYITKPFQIEEVLARVENQLTIQRQKKALKDEITKRQESEAKFLTIFNNSPDPVLISTLAEGYCLDFNDRLCEFLGVNRVEILNKTCVEIEVWDNLQDLQYFKQMLIQEGSIQNFEVVLRTKSREAKTVLLSAKKENLNGEDCVIGILKDISDRILIESILTEQRRLLATVISNLPGMVYRRLNDENWTMEFVSEGCKLVTGYESSELQNNRVIAYSNLIHPEDKDWLWAKCQQSLEMKVPWKNKYRIIDNEGKIRWVYEQAQGNYAPDGTLLMIEGFIQDISKQRAALSQRELAEFALAEAKEAAEAATKAKSAFLVNMSYKIRTSINGVLGMTQLLKTTNLTIEQEDFIQTIQDSGEELLTIINDIVDFAKPDAGMLNVEERILIVEKILLSISEQSEKTNNQKIEIDPQMAEKFPLRILLVEDDLINQKVVHQMLAKFGYQIDVVNNGLEALKAVESQVYDLIFMDMQMPGMDGLTTTRQIRQKLTIQPQIVATTANVSTENYHACLDAGMDDYISKPIKINEIIRVLKSKACPF